MIGRLARHRLEGAAAAAARPPDAGDDGRAAGHAAPAVRLRHQHRRPPHPDGGLRPGPQRRVARPRRAAWRPPASTMWSAQVRELRRDRARAARGRGARGAGRAAALRLATSRAGDAARVQLVVDGSDPQTVASATNTAGVAGRRALDASSLVERLARATARPRRAAARARADHLVQPRAAHRGLRRARPGRRDPDHDDGDAHGDGHRARARARHARAADRLAGAPRRARSIGKIVPYVGIGYVQMTLILLVGRLVFDVPVRRLARRCCTCWRSCSSPPTWRSACSSRPSRKTQQQAMQMSFFFLLPNILLQRLHVPVRGHARARRSCCRRRCRSPTSCASCAASRSRAAASPTSRRELVWLAGILGAAGHAGVAALPQEARLAMARPAKRHRAAHPARRARALPARGRGRRVAAQHRAATRGTNIGMVYYYFPTKDDLFLAVVEEMYVEAARRLRRRRSLPTCRSRSASAGCTLRIGASQRRASSRSMRLVVREALRLVGATRPRDRAFLARAHPLLLRRSPTASREGKLRRDVHPALYMMAMLAIGGPPQLIATFGSRAPRHQRPADGGGARQSPGRDPAPRRGRKGCVIVEACSVDGAAGSWP